ncbi:hypothetical protein IRJ41_006707 [Triplophysa rosa]|uniref:Integrase catalytic domain-containing protein n=1 Tax=Triplophysa rosa TaxID=992332 RepID=A0A9W7T5D4_TRIRA|nr:hypothetical protein IRJ41_006707 [Triplophysa rosa]
MDNIIEDYFRCGFTNREILILLEESHNIILSLRTLERTLQRNRCKHLDVNRWMHQKCWMYGIITDRETVRQLMRLLDGQGVDAYNIRGPNYVWHIDGYDELKPYGICINGCIDGFSRKIIWLEANKTNNDSRVIASYFINAVAENNGYPQRIRIDRGTENNHIAEMQIFFREAGNAECVTIGPSTGNQRIERLWSTLRSQCIQFWMDHFEQLKEDGHFVGSFIDKSLIQFCFQHFIQEDLDETVSAWNCHRIRPTHNPRAPSGRPSIMFDVPSLYGVQNFLYPVDQTKLSICREDCIFKDYPCDEDVFQLCVELMAEHNLVMTNDVYEITDFYLRLDRQLILHGLEMDD